MMKKLVPLHSLVLMVGPSGAGKSTIIAQHFDAYEVVSSDAIREELTGDFNRQDYNPLVFKELNHRIRIKLDLGERVVVDATNLRKQDRQSITSIGAQFGVPIYYIVVNRPIEEKLATQGWRASVPGLVERMDETFRSNEREILLGDHIANVIDTRKESFEVVRKIPKGDISDYVLGLGYQGVMVLGDVHGMRESLKSAIEWANMRNLYMIFLGDIVDYGPKSLECVDDVYDIVTRGRGSVIRGNHEQKIERWIAQDHAFRNNGTPIRLTLSEGNRATTDRVSALSHAERIKWESKFGALTKLAKNHILLGDELLFTHGGAEPEMFRINDHRLGKRLEGMALYGETDQANPREDGYPNRIYTWVDRIPKGKHVIVGHDIRSSIKPLEVVGEKGGTATFMDTGSGKGGHLTTAHIIFEDGKWVVKAFTAH